MGVTGCGQVPSKLDRSRRLRMFLQHGDNLLVRRHCDPVHGQDDVAYLYLSRSPCLSELMFAVCGWRRIDETLDAAVAVTLLLLLLTTVSAIVAVVLSLYGNRFELKSDRSPLERDGVRVFARRFREGRENSAFAPPHQCFLDRSLRGCRRRVPALLIPRKGCPELARGKANLRAPSSRRLLVRGVNDRAR